MPRRNTKICKLCTTINSEFESRGRHYPYQRGYLRTFARGREMFRRNKGDATPNPTITTDETALHFNPAQGQAPKFGDP